MQIDFTMWLTEVDRLLLIQWGVTTDTLPDQDYFGMYKSGDTSQEAAFTAIEYTENGGWV